MSPHDDQLFAPDEVDEQIDWLERASGAQSPTPNTRVIQGLHQLYDNEQADAHSADTVWRRLRERGAVPAPQRQRARRPGLLPRQRESEPLPQVHAPERPVRRSLSTRLLTIAAAVLLVVVVGGLVAGLVLVRHPGPQVANPPPTEIAYIGSDGNVWEMNLSQNITERVTADAQANAIQYSGLAWSPDGGMLAVLRRGVDTTTQKSTYTLLLLLPNGTVLHRVTLAGPLDNQPFAWSPDGKLIAYREVTGQFFPSGDDNKEILHLLNAQSGQEVKHLVFDQGPSGCGGGGYGALANTIWSAHHASAFGIDTFAWAPDQQTILVAYSCPDQASEQLDLSTGATRSVIYPKGASYQPNGHLILGIWPTGPLGLVDFSNTQVRALVQRPSSSSDKNYNQLGWASWSPDGQTIYYEYEDGIWSIGVDGLHPHQMVAGTPQDSQHVATIQLVPSLSPDGTLLLYLQAHGSTLSDYPAPETDQWYVAQADGSHPVPLPQGITEAVWRP